VLGESILRVEFEEDGWADDNMVALHRLIGEYKVGRSEFIEVI